MRSLLEPMIDKADQREHLGHNENALSSAKTVRMGLYQSSLDAYDQA